MPTKLAVTILAIALVLTAGCAHKKQVPPVIDQGGPAVETPKDDGALPAPFDGVFPEADSADFTKVYFDYDKFTLRTDAVNTLNENAAKMKEKLAANPKSVFQVRGHCDERGTQEYNLALGEKRALAVREYLIKVGVDANALYTISYGKERPEKEGHDESAWKWNRRAAFGETTKP